MFAVQCSVRNTISSLAKLVPNCSFFHYILVGASLLGLACTTWWNAAQQAGLYIDEWELFGRFYFNDHSLLTYLQTIADHPRFVIRPGSLPLFATLYYFFGLEAKLYHVLNLFIEWLSALCLYGFVFHYFKRKYLGFIAAALFLVYPTHDCTHYSVTSLATSLSFALFNASLLLYVIFETGGKERKLALAVSYCFFLIGLLTYESIAGLALTYPLVAFLRRPSSEGLLVRVRNSLHSEWFPLLFTVVFVIARTIGLKALGLQQIYNSGFSIEHVYVLFSQGFSVSFLPRGVSFFFSLASNCLQAGIGIMSSLLLIILVLVFSGALVFMYEKNPHPFFEERPVLFRAFIFGLVAFISSYLCFIMAPDYIPVLDNEGNRVNTGATIGASIILASLIVLISQVGKSPLSRAFVSSLLTSCLLLLFVLADWEFSKPWFASTAVQNRALEVIAAKKNQIREGDVILLANVPRYVMWAPLFDGPWDFQSAVQIALKNQAVEADVISDRLKIQDNLIIDRFGEHEIGRYKIANTKILLPVEWELISVSSPDKFVELIEDNCKTFGVPQSVLKRWRMEIQQLKNTGTSPHN